MALYDDVRSKIVRQELDIIEAGQHFKYYSANVKYAPENVEKPEFFSLCYNMLKVCDVITLRTKQQNEYDLLYKFLITKVDVDNKIVVAKLLSKFDLMTNDDNEKQKAVPTNSITTATIVNIVGEQLDKALTPILDKLAIIDELKTTVAEYTKETDDQLEEIENNIAKILTPTLSATAGNKSTKTK